MTPRFFKSFILVNIFKILTNLFLTFIPFVRKTSAIAAATLIPSSPSVSGKNQVNCRKRNGSTHLGKVWAQPFWDAHREELLEDEDHPLSP